VPAGVAGPPVVPPAVANAQFHALHLVTVMTELLPDWLPQQLFDILYARWRSAARMQRHATEGTACVGHPILISSAHCSECSHRACNSYAIAPCAAHRRNALSQTELLKCSLIKTCVGCG